MARNSFIFTVSLLLLLNGFAFCLYTMDKFALLTIKTNIIDHSGILSNNWSATSNASICTWIGVSCDLNNQSVTALNLSGMGLAGTVTSVIGNLSSLTSLDISHNKFSGSVPEELSHLHHLQQLLLFNNNFTGSVPAAIFNISSLRIINLRANNLCGSLPVDICSQSVPKLEQIFLSLNHFEGKIPPSLFKCRELQNLSLSFNEFSGSIPIEIGNLTMLKDLRLGFNNLEGEIPEEIGNLKLLEMLKIPRSSLTGPIPNVIFNMSALKIINLMENKLTGSFPMDIHYNLPALEELYLFKNQLKGQIPSWLLDCKGLRIIALSENKFTGSIPKKVVNLTLLKGLDLSDNNFIEYMPNGSLEKWLYSHNYCLTILERLNIMIDVASALEYLHHGQRTPILHCDIKPSNVLLDKDMIAHVCDFGIAKLLGEDEFMAKTKTLATIGYMAPEYIREGVVSTKGDVYSYGILLMETFTRKRPTDEMFYDNLTMRNWVYEASLSSIVQVVDANLIRKENEDFLPKKECASSVLHLALDCSTSIPIQRITMEDVVVRLNKIKITFLTNTG